MSHDKDPNLIYPAVFLTAKQFSELLDYSLSLPTGTAIGKRWKRNLWKPGVYGQTEYTNDWLMGEYATHENPNKVRIIWKKIIVVPGDAPL